MSCWRRYWCMPKASSKCVEIFFLECKGLTFFLPYLAEFLEPLCERIIFVIKITTMCIKCPAKFIPPISWKRLRICVYFTGVICLKAPMIISILQRHEPAEHMCQPWQAVGAGVHPAALAATLQLHGLDWPGLQVCLYVYLFLKRCCVYLVFTLTNGIFICRKHTENILHKMLLSEHVSYSLVSHIIPCLQLLHTSTNSLVNYLAEVVAELRQPISVVEKAISAEEQRKVDIQVSAD